MNWSPESLQDPIAHYEQHGYAKLGVLATESQLVALRARIEAIMLGEIRYEGMFFQKDTETGLYEDLAYGKGFEGPTFNYRKIEKLEKDRLFLAWIEHEAFRAITHKVVGAQVNLYRALIFNKAAESGGTFLPWHQDGGKFWGLSREPHLQIWTALDDAPENGGCLEVIPGSHKGGLVTPLGGVVQPKFLHSANAEERAIKVPAKAGEVILIHNHLWHRSGRNFTGKPRRGLTACYMDDGIHCLRTKRPKRQFFKLWQSDAQLA